MIELVNCRVTPEEHQKRQMAHLQSGRKLKDSVSKFDFTSLQNVVALSETPRQMDYCPMAYQFGAMPFGAVNTVEKAGCVCFVSYYLLRMYGEEYFPFEKWVNEVVQKGYRIWKFKKFPKVTFCSSTVCVEEVKERFKSLDVDLSDCTTVEELENRLGAVEGVGGSMFLIDNVIAYLNGLTPVEETRFTDVEDVIESIQSECMVPMRVNNAIYHDNPGEEGGHYIILLGIINGQALVWDASVYDGYYALPFERLMKAAVADDGLIAVWDAII